MVNKIKYFNLLNEGYNTIIIYNFIRNNYILIPNYIKTITD